MWSHLAAALLRLSAGLVLIPPLLVIASPANLPAQDQVLGVHRHEKAGVLDYIGGGAPASCLVFGRIAGRRAAGERKAS